ncbi:MAG: hypothetical protein AAF559_12275 [Pseudomonadota bacterium]
MNPEPFYAIAAIAYVVWALRRLYIAWKHGHVVEVDDPDFGFEVAEISRAEKPRWFWTSVAITTSLMLIALVFLIMLVAYYV